MSCDVFRSRASHVGFHHETKVSTFKHHWARLRAAGWTAQPGGADTWKLWGCPQWEESSIQEKWSHTGPSDIGRAVWQVPSSLTANWSTTCCQLCNAKRKSVSDFSLSVMLQSPLITMSILSLHLSRWFTHSKQWAMCTWHMSIKSTPRHSWVVTFDNQSAWTSRQAYISHLRSFSHRTGTMRCLQKEMVTYRHWSVSLWRDPDDVSH